MTIGPDYLSDKGANPLVPGGLFPITPDNSNDLAYVTRCLILNVGGDVKMDVRDPDGTLRTGVVCTLPSGQYSARVTKVYATGTTATGISGIR